MPRLLLFFFLVLVAAQLSGQQVRISGQSPAYAGRELVVYFYPEPVMHQRAELARSKVAGDGSFSLAFRTDQTIEVYADLEKYCGSLIVEPGADYHVTLPPFAPRTATEAASPYFIPEPYWLGIKGVKTTDLNFKARSFLIDFNRELTTHTVEIYQKKSADTARSIIMRLEKMYPASGNGYLEILKSCSYGQLESAVEGKSTDAVIRKYFSGKPVSLSHPAYQQLFSELFSEYLSGKYMDIKEKKFIAPAMMGDFAQWKSTLESRGFTADMAELVAVKSFYDGYYSGKFDRQLMLNGLRQSSDLVTSRALKEILPQVLSQVSSLRNGSPAPPIQVKNASGETKGMKTAGKFLYLVFFRSDSRDCRTELDSLVVLDKKLNTILNILPVSLDPNFRDAEKLWKEHNYPWELTRAVDPEKVTAAYRIKNVPEFYLVSPDLKLVLAPALSPTRNFEFLFLKVYRESRFRKM